MPGYDAGRYDVDALYDLADLPTAPVIPILPPSPETVVFQSSYQMRLYDTSGVLQAVFDDWNSVYFYNRLSDFGYHTISIDGDDPRVALFTTDAIIEIRRRNQSAAIPWYREYIGFHRTGQIQESDRGVKLFSSFGRGLEDLINRRQVLYYAGGLSIDNAPASDAIKRYVRFNAGPEATTANGRIADGVTPGLSIAADDGVGPLWSGDRSFKNVLDVAKEISAATSVDFDIVWQGGQNFTFATHYPQLGTDRTGAGSSSAVIFSIEHANMSEPYLTNSRMSEVTSVFVLGQGEGDARIIVQRDNLLEIGQSPWNRVEFTRDARNEASISALQSLGDGYLAEHGNDVRISFQVVSSPGTVYGRDYFVGDRVLARLFGTQGTRKIIGSEVTVANGQESIRIHFEGEQ
jgi:hypothetical protein